MSSSRPISPAGVPGVAGPTQDEHPAAIEKHGGDRSDEQRECRLLPDRGLIGWRRGRDLRRKPLVHSQACEQERDRGGGNRGCHGNGRREQDTESEMQSDHDDDQRAVPHQAIRCQGVDHTAKRAYDGAAHPQEGPHGDKEEANQECRGERIRLETGSV